MVWFVFSGVTIPTVWAGSGQGAAGVSLARSESMSPASVMKHLAPDELSVIAGEISLSVKDRLLQVVLDSISSKSGITFQLPPQLAQAKVSSAVKSTQWSTVVAQVLRDFSAVTLASEAQPLQVFILGEGEHANPIETVEPVVAKNPRQIKQSAQPETANQVEPAANQPRPDHLAQLPENSVYRLHLDTALLTQMQVGEELLFKVPGAEYLVVLDRLTTHGGAEQSYTWVGHIKDQQPLQRIVLTGGITGVFGRFLTPQGVYKIESVAGLDWLIDMDASNLTAAMDPHDFLLPDESLDTSVNIKHGAGSTVPVHMKHHKPVKGGEVTRADVTSATASAPALASRDVETHVVPLQQRLVTPLSADGKTTVDVLVLYTDGMDARKNRIRNIVELANQAYIDSNIKLKIRMVHSVAIDYSDFTTNNDALSDLTYGLGAFAQVEALRQQYGADLVSLVRPFNYASQKNCGIAWVNGYNSTPFSRDYAYSVVSDGSSGGFFCPDYSFAHELGHNMGSVHDRGNTNVVGAYPYSYGYGESGRFGTVMSYFMPESGVFSNPSLNCSGQACGVDENQTGQSANNALSLNNTRERVAALMATRVDEVDSDEVPDPAPVPELVAYDFNADGEEDVFWRNLRSGNNILWLMKDGLINQIVELPSVFDRKWRVVGMGDYDGDGITDLFWRHLVTGENRIWLIEGNAVKSNVALARVEDRYWDVAASGDFDGDGKDDVLWRNRNDARNWMWLMNGTSVRSQTLLDGMSVRSWKVVGVGDLDQDGVDDIIWHDVDTKSKVAWYMAEGDHTYDVTILPKTQLRWMAASVGDLNGDRQDRCSRCEQPFISTYYKRLLQSLP